MFILRICLRHWAEDKEDGKIATEELIAGFIIVRWIVTKLWREGNTKAYSI